MKRVGNFFVLFNPLTLASSGIEKNRFKYHLYFLRNMGAGLGGGLGGGAGLGGGSLGGGLGGGLGGLGGGGGWKQKLHHVAIVLWVATLLFGILLVTKGMNYALPISMPDNVLMNISGSLAIIAAIYALVSGFRHKQDNLGF